MCMQPMWDDEIVCPVCGCIAGTLLECEELEDLPGEYRFYHCHGVKENDEKCDWPGVYVKYYNPDDDEDD